MGQMHHEWPRLSGLLLDERIPLGSFLREEAGAGIFATDYAQAARICVIPADDSDAEARFAAWTAAMTESFPGVLRVHEVGRDVLDGVLVVFAATERPDAYLEEAVAQRELTREEAAELVAAIAPALDNLHTHGWALGGFGSEAIVSVNGTVKLLPHTLRRDAAAAQDDDASLRKFRRAAAVAQTPVPPPRRLLPVLVAAIVVLLLGLVALRAWRDHKATVAQAADAARRPNPVPIPEAPAARSRTAESPRSRTVAPPPAATTAVRTPVAGAGDWAVIAAIYRDYDAAERRARSMMSKWRHSTPAVFPERGAGRQYMVVLASGVQAAEAARLRDLARQQGLPRDTYITRLRR